MDPTPITRNVKISFPYSVSECISKLSENAHKITNSYIILKSIYTFTIYYKSNLVNITGIPNFQAIPLALQQFHMLAATFLDFECSVAIDNSTANGQFNNKINFNVLNKHYPIRYNPSLFPGAFLILPNKKRIILFKSGKYVIVGCKSQDQINDSFIQLQRIIVNHVL